MARDFAPSIRDALELGHPGQIDIGALRVCGTTWYANTALQRVEPGVPGPVVRSAGSWWLVGLCQRGAIAVSLAIAARSDATIANNHLVFPDSSGNDFFPQGVPSSWDGPLPASPENAVIGVARATGLRISQVPRLVARPLSFVEPQGAMWQIIVEQSVTLHGLISGRSVTLDTLYYGLTGPVGTALTPSVAIPEADQPVSVTVTLGGSPPRMFTLSLLAGTPTLFERIAQTH